MFEQVAFIELVYMWDLKTLCCLHCTYGDISGWVKRLNKSMFDIYQHATNSLIPRTAH